NPPSSPSDTRPPSPSTSQESSLRSFKSSIHHLHTLINGAKQIEKQFDEEIIKIMRECEEEWKEEENLCSSLVSFSSESSSTSSFTQPPTRAVKDDGMLELLLESCGVEKEISSPLSPMSPGSHEYPVPSPMTSSCSGFGARGAPLSFFSICNPHSLRLFFVSRFLHENLVTSAKHTILLSDYTHLSRLIPLNETINEHLLFLPLSCEEEAMALTRYGCKVSARKRITMFESVPGMLDELESVWGFAVVRACLGNCVECDSNPFEKLDEDNVHSVKHLNGKVIALNDIPILPLFLCVGTPFH
ncbi:hypothetical protein ADUPG1_013749, partial [Aduncisulcus paluster]